MKLSLNKAKTLRLLRRDWCLQYLIASPTKVIVVVRPRRDTGELRVVRPDAAFSLRSRDMVRASTSKGETVYWLRRQFK